jgi:hypothetical protein
MPGPDGLDSTLSRRALASERGEKEWDGLRGKVEGRGRGRGRDGEEGEGLGEGESERGARESELAGAWERLWRVWRHVSVSLF